MPIRVKICGITRPDDARAAVELGADAIGLNLVPASPRCIEVPLAKAIARQISGRAAVVLVVQDPDPAWLARVLEEIPDAWIQFHGNEPASAVSSWGRPVIKAFRLKAASLDPVVQYARQVAGTGHPLNAVLCDAFVAGQGGGTGKTLPWGEWLRARPSGLPPLILAGGLTAENVARAIHVAQPYGVDVASGVETEPGRKDWSKMEAFIREARRALNQTLKDN